MTDALVARWGVPACARRRSCSAERRARWRAPAWRRRSARSREWPWATFLVNLAGTVLLAWMTTRLTEMVAPTRFWRFLLGTGFCGALTTFSTFQIETIRLARDSGAALAGGYALASLACGMVLAAAATVVARRRRYG